MLIDVLRLSDCNSTPKLVIPVNPYTLQGKSLPVPQNQGKYFATNIDKIAILVLSVLSN